MNERGGQSIRERTFDFACRIIHLHQHLAKNGPTARALGLQLLRSGTSIGANLEEASAGSSKKDFIAKCSIALKEARESYYWLRLLIQCEIIGSDRLRPLCEESNELVAVLTAIIRNARRNENAKEP